jgi:hypothetical protein
VLHSAAARIAFAHFPKTAGHSLIEWFRGTFADAAFVEADAPLGVSHLPVRESLLRLGVNGGYGRRLGRVGRRIVRSLVPFETPPGSRWRVIGVVREPLEMLVSLYEYWRDYPFEEVPATALIHAARAGSFRGFLNQAVVRGSLPKYENFFDVGGTAWKDTRLLDFATLDGALATVAREWGFDVPSRGLARRNVGPRPDRDLSAYADEAGPLLLAVHAHFRWYYSVARRVVVRGGEPARGIAAA